MSEFSRFPLLPKELRDMIWDFACPELIVEFGEPSDRGVPVIDLRKAWVASRRPLAIAQACHESRAYVLRESVDREGKSYIDELRDKRCRLRITKVIHFNSPVYSQMNRRTRFNVEDNLIGTSKALELGKMVSLHADLIHPFIHWRGLCDMDHHLLWDAFCKLKQCIITIHTICIRATKEQAAHFGAFDGGEEPTKLVDAYDGSTMQPFRQLWYFAKDQDVSWCSARFFEMLDTPRFNFRIARWLAELEARFVQFAWEGPPYPIEHPQVAISMLLANPKNRSDPIVKAYLENMPKLKLCVMFRLVPPLREPPVGDIGIPD
jgi:hypothetical protein